MRVFVYVGIRFEWVCVVGILLGIVIIFFLFLLGDPHTLTALQAWC